MKRTSFAAMHCSLARSLEVMGDWWTPLILRDLYLGLGRFADLAANLAISKNLLTTRLAALVENGLVARRRYSERPPRDRYELTAAGRELVPILMALTAWGDRWVAPSQGAPIRFQHRTCGEVFTPAVGCSRCGAPLELDDVVALPGPGGRAATGTRLIAKLLRERAPEPHDPRRRAGHGRRPRAAASSRATRRPPST